MIARVVKCQSIAEWNFSLWFALLSLREFAENSRIFAAFAPGANRAPQFFFSRKSVVQNLSGT
jgi:hypothetical protein